MTAALAQCGRVAAVIPFRKPDKVHVRGRTSHGKRLSHNVFLLSLFYFLSPDALCAETVAASSIAVGSVWLFPPLNPALGAYLARMPSRTHLAEAGIPSPYATDLNRPAFSGYSIVRI